MGEVQPIKDGYVYLGDPNTVALGFNLHAGGAIGKLLYHGTELVDDFDYGRYIQFSPYDGSEDYGGGANGFTPWGWNPLQAGSLSGVPSKVQEYRRWADGLYIKAPGVEWAHLPTESDVTYETWAWDRGGYFEIHTRLTHTGTDVHAFSGAEFPATYFGASIPIEFGYLGSHPFTAQPIETYDYSTINMGADPPVFPSENWMAFGNSQGNGLILAMPYQPYLSPMWGYIFIRNSYPDPIGYAGPTAIFETRPAEVIDLTYFLIPGPLEHGREVVYDLIPHTSWTFDLNSAEGWRGSGQSVNIQSGKLTTTLSPGETLISAPGLDFYGSHTPKFGMTIHTQENSAQICLRFITASDWAWDDKKSSCQTIQNGDYKDYTFDLSTNPAWMNGLIKQLQITSVSPTVLEIDHLQVEYQFYGWEFNNPQNTDGWFAWWMMQPLQIVNGSLTSTVTGSDPYLGSPYLGIDAARFNRIEIRMRTTQGGSGQIFFSPGQRQVTKDETSVFFPITSDGEYHVYTINLAYTSLWQGTIMHLRLDPMDSVGDFSIDYIHILPATNSYDPFLYTTWEFNSNDAEGWTSTSDTIIVGQGILTAQLSKDDYLTSLGGRYFYGNDATTVSMNAQVENGSGQLCMQFITSEETEWSDSKATCLPSQTNGFQEYEFDFSNNQAWLNGRVTQLRLQSSAQVAVQIDKIQVNPYRYGWEFHDPLDPDGWSVWNQILPLTMEDGSILSTATGDDPYMGSSLLDIPAEKYSQIEIRMRMTKSSDAQIFFITDQDSNFSKEKSQYFPIISDGEYHVYQIEMSNVSTWKNRIRQIRLDPMTAPGDFEIDYIRVTKP